MLRPYLWRMTPPGVYRVHHLDAHGYHTIVAVDADHRQVASVRVFGHADECRVAAELRAWLKHPEPRPPLPEATPLPVAVRRFPMSGT